MKKIETEDTSIPEGEPIIPSDFALTIDDEDLAEAAVVGADDLDDQEDNE